MFYTGVRTAVTGVRTGVTGGHKWAALRARRCGVSRDQVWRSNSTALGVRVRVRVRARVRAVLGLGWLC